MGQTSALPLKFGHSAEGPVGVGALGNCRQMNPEGIQSLSPELRASATLGAAFIKDQQP